MILFSLWLLKDGSEVVTGMLTPAIPANAEYVPSLLVRDSLGFDSGAKESMGCIYIWQR